LSLRRNIPRDYSMRGTNISVNVFDDRVEVVSPGGFPKGITKSNFGKESVRRNLIIADLFHRMDKMEKVGSGIRRMRNLVKAAGLKELVFESDTFLRVIFYRDPDYSLKSRGQNVVGKTGANTEEVRRKYGENMEKVLLAIQQDPFIKTHEVADKNQLAQRTVEKAVAMLKKARILKRIGPDKGGHWEVIEVKAP